MIEKKIGEFGKQCLNRIDSWINDRKRVKLGIVERRSNAHNVGERKGTSGLWVVEGERDSCRGKSGGGESWQCVRLN